MSHPEILPWSLDIGSGERQKQTSRGSVWMRCEEGLFISSADRPAGRLALTETGGVRVEAL